MLVNMGPEDTTITYNTEAADNNTGRLRATWRALYSRRSGAQRSRIEPASGGTTALGDIYRYTPYGSLNSARMKNAAANGHRRTSRSPDEGRRMKTARLPLIGRSHGRIRLIGGRWKEDPGGEEASILLKIVKESSRKY